MYNNYGGKCISRFGCESFEQLQLLLFCVNVALEICVLRIELLNLLNLVPYDSPNLYN